VDRPGAPACCGRRRPASARARTARSRQRCRRGPQRVRPEELAPRSGSKPSCRHPRRQIASETAAQARAVGGRVQIFADTNDQGAGMSAVVVVQSELWVRHGRSFTNGSGLGIGRRLPVRRRLAAGQILLPEHSAGQEPEDKDRTYARAATRACPRRSHWARCGRGNRRPGEAPGPMTGGACRDHRRPRINRSVHLRCVNHPTGEHSADRTGVHPALLGTALRPPEDIAHKRGTPSIHRDGDR